MTDTEEIVVVDIQRLHLEPGDVLIYTYPGGKLTAETIDRISHQLRQAFDADIPIVVLDRGAKLQVVNKNELQSST
jgi:hypothetical protein